MRQRTFRNQNLYLNILVFLFIRFGFKFIFVRTQIISILEINLGIGFFKIKINKIKLGMKKYIFINLLKEAMSKINYTISFSNKDNIFLFFESKLKK